MKIAITGANGRVGQALVAHLQCCGHDVIPLTRAAFDLAAVDEIYEHLKLLDFDCLLNPAAMSAPDLCESQRDLCERVNTLAPARMASFCAAHGKKMIHFSTDYVFSGKREGKCHEDDDCDPINHYGHCKRLGEIGVLEAHPAALILRVSWIYGGKIPGFVDQVITKLSTQQPVAAVADKWSIPTLLPDLCEWVATLCEHTPAGILHACHAGEPVSWHGLALAVQESMMRQGKISHTTPIAAQSLREISSFVAARPVHTAMDNAHLAARLPQPIAPWRDALERWVSHL